MEELLRQAFQLGQQWVQDMNNDKEPTNFNEWYSSNEVQEQVKNCSIPAVSRRSEQLVCDMCGSSKLEECGSNEYSCEECGHFPITN